jgi:hypothetical protein
MTGQRRPKKWQYELTPPSMNWYFLYGENVVYIYRKGGTVFRDLQNFADGG